MVLSCLFYCDLHERCLSWPGLSRPSTPCFERLKKTWMPATSAGMTECDAAPMRTLAGNFSVGRLMEFLTALGQDVRITVKPTRKAVGEMEVVAG